MRGGLIMNNLHSTIEKAYSLPNEEQNALVELIDTFINNVSKSKMKTHIRRAGKFDGKYKVVDDIDFCNDEIAELFDVKKI